MAYLNLKWQDQNVAMIPMSKNHIDSFMSDFASGFMQKLQDISGKEFALNYHEAALLSDISQKTISAIGSSITVANEIPILAKLTGKIRIDVTDAKRFSLKLDLNPRYTNFRYHPNTFS